MSTTERTSPSTSIDRPRLGGRLARRLAGPAWVIMTLACILITLIVSRYLTFNPEVYFPEQRAAYLQREFILGVHVLSGMIALLIGPFQFVGRLRRRFVRMHRLMGASYVASATGLGLSGLILAPTAYTGVVASVGFTVLDLAMLFTTWTAVRMIFANRFGDHRRWMIRSFSLIMAGVMLRVWVPIYGALAAAGIVNFSFETAYAAIAWLCWVPNLLLAIWFTRHTVR
jgi:hypothetical protein